MSCRVGKGHKHQLPSEVTAADHPSPHPTRATRRHGTTAAERPPTAPAQTRRTARREREGGGGGGMCMRGGNIYEENYKMRE